MTEVLRSSTAAAVKLSVQSRPSEDWDAFVDGIPGRAVYFRSGWVSLANQVFGHQVFFIEARDERNELLGVLPLVRQRGLLGTFAISIPFFNYGGVLARSSEVAATIMQRARQLARDLGCSYLELRDVQLRDANWSVRQDKVTMVLDLPNTVEALSERLGSKLRSQIKRAERESVEVRSGGMELVADFYHVFAHNMRDLGTPVYPRRFFEAMIRRFPDDIRLLIVDHAGKPAAAAFLVLEGGRAEIPWAACLAKAKPMGMNMKLYWEALRLAIERDCSCFDFGRSTVDSGTFRFKRQWGARPVQLYWHRWERNPAPASAASEDGSSPLMSYAVAIWQRLPLPVANALGPLVSPSLPW